MKIDYAEVIIWFNEEVDHVLFRGGEFGLSDQEMADELRRIADDLAPKR